MSSLEEIPLIPEGQFILHWIREAGREQQVLFLSEGEIETEVAGASDYGNRRPGRSRLQIDSQRRLILVDRDGQRTELATFCGPRNGLKVQRVSETPDRHSCFLLNGNGFEDTMRQGLQARLRERVVREHGAWNVMVVPYDALHAAQIVLESIEPIEITADTNAQRQHTFRENQIPTPNNRLANRQTENRRQSGLEWRLEGTNWNGDWASNVGGMGGFQYTLQVRWQPPNGTLGWYRVNRVSENGVNYTGRISYREHRLGASIFWAEAPNGRHRYISAFDMQENPPMYFLAQLPDGPEVTDYDSALAALQPPIVRATNTEGSTAPRHGDIFFVPTNLSDTDMEGQGKIYQRRHTGRRILTRGGAGGGSRWVTMPPSRRVNRRVCLLGTGHTADRVVRTEDGRTFAQGTVRHEPHLVPGDEERAAEHSDLVLPAGVWHLCVRNTVPSA